MLVRIRQTQRYSHRLSPEEGVPVAGVAEGPVDVPVGSPLGGYSNRCTYLGGASKIDRRQNHYTQAWSPSVGIQTAAMAEVLWLETQTKTLS